MLAAVTMSTIQVMCENPKSGPSDQKSLHIGFPLQNKMKLQPFSLFLMIFMQTDLKVKQTGANTLLNCLLLSISEHF